MASEEKIKIITPYEDIPFAEIEQEDNSSRVKGNTMEVGFGSKALRVDKEGLWLGAAKFANAPFKVDMQGNVTASSITLSGYVAVGGAAADVNAGATTIGGGKITAGSITADRMSVTQLSAIAANLGTITAGSISAVTISGSTITGSTLTTASSGQRVVLTSTLAQYYNSGGIQVGTTYGDTGGFIVSSDSGTLRMNGTSSAIITLTGATFHVQFDLLNSRIIPSGNGGLDLGAVGAAFGSFYLIGTFRYQAINQPVQYWGYVSGTVISPTNDGTMSASNPSAGVYTITHNLGHTNYVVQVTPFAATVKNITVSGRTTTTFTVRVANLADALENNDFMFIIFETP